MLIDIIGLNSRIICVVDVYFVEKKWIFIKFLFGDFDFIFFSAGPTFIKKVRIGRKGVKNIKQKKPSDFDVCD